MYAGDRYDRHPDRAAFVMASTGETVSYAELERRTNRLAHLLRAEGLQRLDHYAIFMENNNRYLECNGAGERSGLYYTCINSYLTAEELAYIVDNSESQVLDHVHRQAAGGTGGARALPAGQALPGGRRRRRGAGAERCALRRLRRGHHRPTPTRRLPTSGSARRCCIRRAPPAGRRASCDRCPRTRRRQPLPLFDFLEQAVAMPRRHALPVTGAAVPLGAAGQRVAGHPQRRHRGDHGALRPRAVSRAGREVPDHAHPAGADDVQPHAQAARSGAPRYDLSSLQIASCTPPRPARCR